MDDYFDYDLAMDDTMNYSYAMDYTAMYDLAMDDAMDDMDDVSTRIIIFLVIGVCVGVPAVSWALRMLFLHVRGGGRVSIFIIFLLFSDILELFLIPFLIASMSSNVIGRHGCGYSRLWYFYDRDCPIALIVAFIGPRLCGLCFHQLVALESILSLRHPHCVSCLSSPFCSIPISVAIWICPLIYFISPSVLSLMCFALLPVAVIVAILSCVFTAKASCSCADPGTTSRKDRGTSVRVLAVAMGALWVLYAPFLFVPLWIIFPYIGSMFVCIMSFRVVADPLLCVLVFKKNPQRQPTQTGIELNTVQTSD
ncbi:hypothetical protein AALO_G00302020 [Alosa alosa]|uniref:G-protein coupled receptors family 1 profile domain-containing protein n=1 Tax=Alosa alosa TaxID=278164 RepID=A0AAV6FJN6_9TELE|nr:uncharacterized protein LOC125289729 [Alosa alosa]KAG5261275.1 hypothetical protein AALO_G00302020 [Alosa alosa]